MAVQIGKCPPTQVRPERHGAWAKGTTPAAELQSSDRPPIPHFMPPSHFRLPRISWRDLAITMGPYIVLVAIAFWVTWRFVRPAPPDTIVLTAGSEGSIFQATAERYRKILAREGVTLRILPSEGSLQNLKRLADPHSNVDAGFVQGGLGDLADATKVVSLGSVFYAPVVVFYRAPRPIALLSGLRGKSIAIGREGSGTRVVAEALLKA